LGDWDWQWQIGDWQLFLLGLLICYVFFFYIKMTVCASYYSHHHQKENFVNEFLISIYASLVATVICILWTMLLRKTKPFVYDFTKDDEKIQNTYQTIHGEVHSKIIRKPAKRNKNKEINLAINFSKNENIQLPQFVRDTLFFFEKR
jgi:hypothetical protein